MKMAYTNIMKKQMLAIICLLMSTAALAAAHPTEKVLEFPTQSENEKIQGIQQDKQAIEANDKQFSPKVQPLPPEEYIPEFNDFNWFEDYDDPVNYHHRNNE